MTDTNFTDRAKALNESTLTIGSSHVPKVICPKHGTHEHTITSTISGHRGVWCMICALEKLGDPLPTTTQAEYESNP